MEVVSAGAVATQLELQVPLETRHWVILKEGFLSKTKTVKGVFKSTVLRYFVLKQDPVKLEARIEYYEGMLFRGSATLRGASVKPSKQKGQFTLTTPKRTRIPARTFFLAVEAGDINEATKWVLALQQAISAPLKASKQELEPTPTPSKVPLQPIRAAPAPPGAAEPGAAAADGPQRIPTEEIDGYAIDEARWAALRKRNDSVYV